ncbi:AMIN-like domain-containing (lipo)protein [Streptomyces tubercidicus]
MRRLGTVAAAFVLAGVGVAGTAGVAGAATGPVGDAAPATTCSTVWGSGNKSAKDANATPLKNIKTSRNACYDRMVFDISGAPGKAGFHVGYVDAFHQDGSGEKIPVKGGAILQVFVSAPSHDPETGKQTYAATAGKPLPGVNLAGYRTFKDTKFGASFEGQTQVGLGVRAKLPFRVQQSGDQLIVDVAHTW